jgi:hypothetical protein
VCVGWWWWWGTGGAPRLGGRLAGKHAVGPLGGHQPLCHCAHLLSRRRQRRRCPAGQHAGVVPADAPPAPAEDLPDAPALGAVNARAGGLRLEHLHLVLLRCQHLLQAGHLGEGGGGEGVRQRMGFERLQARAWMLCPRGSAAPGRDCGGAQQAAAAHCSCQAAAAPPPAAPPSPRTRPRPAAPPRWPAPGSSRPVVVSSRHSVAARTTQLCRGQPPPPAPAPPAPPLPRPPALCPPTCGVHTTRPALAAKSSVCLLCSRCHSGSGVMQAMSAVRALPPRLSCSSRVSLESL